MKNIRNVNRPHNKINLDRASYIMMVASMIDAYDNIKHNPEFFRDFFNMAIDLSRIRPKIINRKFDSNSFDDMASAIRNIVNNHMGKYGNIVHENVLYPFSGEVYDRIMELDDSGFWTDIESYN